MRIDALHNVAQLYQTNNVRKSTSTSKAAERDSFELSSVGKDIQTAKQAAAASSDVRMDRVEALKAQMAAGTYNVSTEKLADKLIGDYFGVSL